MDGSMAARRDHKETLADWDEEPNLADLGFAEAVAHGLSLSPKRIGSKWLYDAEGARLFERIVASPRYYLGHCEKKILGAHAEEIAGLAGPGVSLVELGSGSSSKVRILLDALENPRCYVPIEISEAQLEESAAAIRRDYPGVEVLPLAADYMKDFALPPQAREGRPLAFFPGSTLCNLLPQNSVAFLRRLKEIVGAGSFLLLGVDLKKDKETLLSAYNDPGGAIWNFNLNFLERMNRELGTDLDRASFRHEATWNEAAGRVEAALYPVRDQQVTVAGRRVLLLADEPIFLEYSHKYRIDEFQNLARESGWKPLEVWTDHGELFSVHLLRTA